MLQMLRRELYVLFHKQIISWVLLMAAPSLYAMLFCNLFGGRKGILIFYRNDLIIYLCIKGIGYKPCSDTLNLMRSRGSCGKHG